MAAFSQELVLPPDNPPSAVWVQRYPDGQPVETATGFGNKNSSHCAFAPPFPDYIKKAYLCSACCPSKHFLIEE